MHHIPLNVKEAIPHLLDKLTGIEEVNGGLFNYVYKINTTQDSVIYLKIFTDKAKSDDFPPLPTSPYQRCFIATSSHKTAYESSQTIGNVNVPMLLESNLENYFVLMTESTGTPLFDSLLDRKYPLTSILNSYNTCMHWLANMHTTAPGENLEAIGEYSNKFKQYKIELQYLNLITSLPIRVQQPAKYFVENYLTSTNQLVHGDLNSKNILISNNDVNIIDFEQGHLGSGIYDVAYICSELVIRMIIDNDDVETHINSLLNMYSGDLCADEINNYRRHLAFQVLYRLVGPSKKTWSGHLSELEIIQVKSWAISELEKYF